MNKQFLLWPGSKTQLAPRIGAMIPQNTQTYVEPFVGSGAVFFRNGLNNALLSDINTELINTFRVVRDDLDNLIDLLTEYSQRSCQEFYYAIRNLDRDDQAFASLSNLERAARFMYINRRGYCGLYRTNRAGQCNVSYNHNEKRELFNASLLRQCSKQLDQDVQLECMDYVRAIKRAPENSFVYLDPPYVPLSASESFVGYQPGEFGLKQHTELRNLCLELDGRGIKFVQSNSDTEIVRDLYAGFTIETVDVRRKISARTRGQYMTREVLISN
ncbi:DNA adenine methylase [Actinomyces vulturis]|uniref:DNA adenine methylase n=1 Tax=Actinomyces vulturis TaxID=1857645 RepID=UPI00159EED07|nr:Dam family site-specific DNA-(adenine-N6)-methyltransferase [Actinomyces vulturis]